MIPWLLFLALVAFIIYYGYHLIVKHGEGAADADALSAACHLCKRRLPVHDMIARDKDAGFVNYFCGECIRTLYDEFARTHGAPPRRGE